MDGSAVLYNTLSDEMALLEPALADIYEQHADDEIRQIHPQFHQFLLDKKFLVDDTTDEFKVCIDKWDKEDNDPTNFTITINPTLDCNMRCWYCYEKHEARRSMTDDVLNSIIRLIDAKTSDEKLERLSLLFFGGEPLMKYTKIVHPLIEHARTQCKQSGKKLSVGFVTNASLLTPKVIDYLNGIGIPVHFQITMDGNRTLHNNTRHTASGKGSYDLILSNMSKVAALQNVSITLRLNYTQDNIDSFLDLAEDLSATCGKHKKSINVDLQQVWQDAASSELLDDKIERVRKAFSDNGFSVSGEKRVYKYRCYADRNNHVVVNYDGNLFHCTARDFTPDKAEGVLTPEGDIIKNDKAALRTSLKWGNEACSTCKAYPICHGGCSQHKLETANIYGCIESYDQQQVDNLIEKRIRFLIKQSKVCANNNN